MEKIILITTPGGTQSTIANGDARGISYSGEPATTCSDRWKMSRKIRYKKSNFFATFNANSMMKTGKLKQLTDVLTQHQITIAAIQETRYTDQNNFDSEGYRIFKGKKGKPVGKNVPNLGTAFIVDKKILDSIVSFSSCNSRISILSFKSMNKIYSVVNVHAPTNQMNKLDPVGTDKFWEDLEECMANIPSENAIILVGDFNAQVGKEQKYQSIVGRYPAHTRTNCNGKRLIELCKAFQLIMKSTAFKHLPRKQKTWVAPNSRLGEFQIDHVAIARKAQSEIQNVKVLRNAKIDSDHYLSKIKVKLIPKNTKRNPGKKCMKFDTDKLKDNAEFATKVEIANPNNWNNYKEH